MSGKQIFFGSWSLSQHLVGIHIKSDVEDGDEDGGEGLELSFSHESNKTTTNCGTTKNKIDWKLPKMMSYPKRQRGGRPRGAGKRSDYAI